MLLPIPNPDVIHKAVGDGAVLLSTKDEVYYGLNAVGTCIWERLSPVYGAGRPCAPASARCIPTSIPKRSAEMRNS